MAPQQPSEVSGAVRPIRRPRPRAGPTVPNAHTPQQRTASDDVERPNRTWMVALGLGVPVAALSAVLPAVLPGTAADPLTHALRAAAVLAAGAAVIKRGRAWALIVAACAVWAVLAAVPGPGLLMLVPYPALAAGLVWLSRSGGPVAPGLLVDAGVITGAAAIGGWLLVEPAGGGTGLAYVILDLLLVAAALRLVGFGGRPPPAHLMLTAAIAALVGGDIVHALGSSAYPLYSLWTVGVAAAALHPASARRPRGRSGPVAVSPRRLAVFAVLALLVPLAPALVRDAPMTALVPGVLGAGVALLLVVRLAMLASLVGRTAEALAYTRAQREALRNELTHRANHDPLTGLASRAALTARLCGPQKQKQTLVLFDLDGFAEINDAHGHEIGDALLMEVAGRLRATLKSGTVLARLSGDEFALLCRGDGEPVARRALAALRPAYRIGARELHVTASAGMVRIPAGSYAADALRDADLALDAAKTTGRDRLVLFRPELKEALLRRSTLAHGLRHALARDELRLHFQPVVELATGRIVAAEALLRWRFDGEPVPPTQFVPIAEQTGLIVPIGWWALREACTQAARWHRDHGVAVTVNVSAHQLREDGFADGVLGELEKAGTTGEALIIEVTESVLIMDADATRATLERLRENGVRVAVDDFGTGYSSLSYLMSLPVDVLKLDRAFVAPEHEHRQYAITGAVLQLAAVLDLVTIAEGVEDEGQARALTRLKCPLAQGYLYSTPVPAAEVDLLLAK